MARAPATKQLVDPSQQQQQQRGCCRSSNNDVMTTTHKSFFPSIGCLLELPTTLVFSHTRARRFYKSLQQTMLSRDLTEYAVYSNEARRLLLYMATSKAPDELYFPTLTQLDKRFADR